MIATRSLLAGVAAAALLAGVAGTANAATITSGFIQITNTHFVTPGVNDFWGTTAAPSVVNTTEAKATVSLLPGLVPSTFNVTFTLVFREAGWNNEFRWNPTGQTLTNSQIKNNTFPTDVITAPNSFTVTGVGAGVLDFSFILGANAPDGIKGTVVRNDDFAIGIGEGRVASFLGTATMPGGALLPANQLYLALDDGGGAKADGTVDDDNHDDMIILMTVTAVPQEVAEPATLGILGLGLAGIGLLARRRRLA